MAIQQLFNSTSREKYAKNLNTITIFDKKRSVILEGILLDNFNITISEDWENLFNIRDKFAGAQKLLNAGGVGLFNAGAWTQKVFRGGGYLEISPKFRIYDKDCDGSCILSIKRLFSNIVPNYEGKFNRLGDVYNAAKSVIQSSKETIRRNLESITDNPIETSRKVFNQVKEEASDVLSGESNLVENAFSAFTDLELIKQLSTSSPQPIGVEFSSMFRYDDMVVTNVSVDFSKEFSLAGPLYADVSLSLSSLVAVDKATIDNGIQGDYSNYEVK